MTRGDRGGSPRHSFDPPDLEVDVEENATIAHHVFAVVAVIAACVLLIGSQYRSIWKVCETTGRSAKGAREETVERKSSPPRR